MKNTQFIFIFGKKIYLIGQRFTHQESKTTPGMMQNPHL
jgi:hypothetical protein